MSNIRKFPYKDKTCLEVAPLSNSLLILNDWLSLVAQELNIEKTIERQLFIVVDEIFSNIVKYANLGTDSLVKFDISFDTDEESLELKFADKGIAYNPLQAENPDTNASVEARKIGGLGIFIVKKIMDSVDYLRDGDSNVLILRKSLKGKGSA